MLDMQKALTAVTYLNPDMKEFVRRMVTVVEGSEFTNDPSDAGGATKYGVSIRYALGQGLIFDFNHDGRITADDIKLVTPEIAMATFVYDFFLSPGLNNLPTCMQEEAMDASVNQGPGASIKLVQRTVNHLRRECPDLAAAVPVPLVEDGGYGGKTNTAIHQAASLLPSTKLVNTFCDLRDQAYDTIVANDPTQSRYIRGWKLRADSFRIPDAPKGKAPVDASKRVDMAPPFKGVSATFFQDAEAESA